VREVTGVWKELTESVNAMANNLTVQVRNIADVTIAVANGDLSKKITVDVRGEILQLKEAINTMVDQLRSFASEVTRVAREVGTEGKLGGQAHRARRRGHVEGPHRLGQRDVRQPHRPGAEHRAGDDCGGARGPLAEDHRRCVSGEILELKETINTMVDQLNGFAGEVTRVAREVGTEGKLGGQAQVPGVAGTWKDLTDNVNFMAQNLTAQVRNIAEVSTAIANGDLSKKITVNVSRRDPSAEGDHEHHGRPAERFAGEVTRVAREVGTEGQLGGQANVPGVGGTWKDLTDNVNSMAVEPHGPGPQHRRGDDGRGQRRSVQEDHRRRQGRDPAAEGTPSTRWWTS
jgi:HAMP domain-containing protein